MNFKNLKPNLIAILCCVALLLSNCKEDPCDTTICGNGTCDEGICTCLAGYEGTGCIDEQRTKALGYYTGIFKVGTQSQSGTFTKLEKDPNDVTRIIWDDDYHFVMSGSDTFTVPMQLFGSSGGTIEGTGSVNGTQLTIVFQYTLGAQVVNCTYIGNR